MPRFFFHLHNHIEARDEEGQELAGVDAARHVAEQCARDMAAESVREGQLVLSHYIEVTDSMGEPIARVSFGEVVTIVR